MQEDLYRHRVLARASHRWHNENIDYGDLKITLTDFIAVGNRLDRIKKHLMYGKQFSWKGGEPTADDLRVIQEVPVPSDRDQRLIHAMLGVATEGVEMIEAVFQFFANGTPFDEVNLTEEFGDVNWYRVFGISELGQTEAENRAQNDRKLERRFGSVFSEQAAIERDLAAERSELEGAPAVRLEAATPPRTTLEEAGREDVLGLTGRAVDRSGKES